MNILIISNIYPYETGGAEIQAKFLAEAWIRQGHHVTVAGNRIPSKQIKYENTQHFECVNISTVKANRFTRAVSYTSSLLCFILRRRRDFDIIYCRFIQEAAILISFFKKLQLISIPLIACAECSGSIGDAAVLARLPANNFFIDLIKNQCDSIVVISTKIKQELVSIGLNEKKFLYIPNGIHISKNNNFELWHSAQKKIIFIGRLCDQKGIIYLMQAVNFLKKRNISIVLTIVGDGPLMMNLKRLSISMDIDNIVKFTGKIENEKIAPLLTEHHIFALPSLFEGFGIAVIEAMAAGLPVVVTRCGGPEDFVDNSVGRVAEAGNAESLAQALHELLELSDEELQAMGQAARERVKNNFDIDVIADKYIELFKQHI